MALKLEEVQAAIEMARKGLIKEALAALQRMILDQETKPYALAAMAFCHEKSGELSTARYLYAEAVRLKPSVANWRSALERCDEAMRKRANAYRVARPPWWPPAAGIGSILVALLFYKAAFPGAVADAIRHTVYINPTDLAVILVLFAAVAGIAGLGLLGWWGFGFWRHIHGRLVGAGENFENFWHKACPACGLRRWRTLMVCPFCGTAPEKPKPKEKPPQEAQPAPPREPARESTPSTSWARADGPSGPPHDRDRSGRGAGGGKTFGFDTLIGAIDVAFDWQKIVFLFITIVVCVAVIALGAKGVYKADDIRLYAASPFLLLIWLAACVAAGMAGVARLVELELSQGARASLGEAFEFVISHAIGLFLLFLVTLIGLILAFAMVDGGAAWLTAQFRDGGAVVGGLLVIPVFAMNLLLLLFAANTSLLPCIMAVEDCAAPVAVGRLIQLLPKRGGQLLTYEMITFALLSPALAGFMGILFATLFASLYACGMGGGLSSLDNLVSDGGRPFGSFDAAFMESVFGRINPGEAYLIPAILLAIFFVCFALVYLITCLSIIYKAVRNS